ncbi:MAG: hypothetical protein E7258_05355 [Lachnospiraceae bacterium]|nr:hypothetical protein [Lachnospiraceae bacterium]
MIRQIKLLSKVLLANTFGINKLRYGKDKTDKIRFFIVLVAMLFLIVSVGLLVYKMFSAYCKAGLGFPVPTYLYVFVSILTLVFTIFKSGAVLFSIKDYDMLISLPVSKAAIVISRFITMYVNNILVSLIILVPGIGTYVYYERPEISFYIICLISVLFLPLLPLTIASIIGAIITAISSRMRNKNLVEIVLTFGLFFGIFYIESILTDKSAEMTPAMLQDLATFFNDKIKQIYLPAGWFGEAINGNKTSFILLILVPILVFGIFALIVGKYFQSICSSINAISAKNNYRLETLKENSITNALLKKEFKRYFSSSIYVTNTLIGYILGAVMCVIILILGKEAVLNKMGLGMIASQVDAYFPFIISLMFALMSITASSISMEGKNLWQVKILPVKSIDVYNSKILLNLIIAAPFYIISVITLVLAVKPSGLNMLFMIVLPLCYIVFSAVLGITINLHFPNFNWENEAVPVKQGMSTLFTMIISLASVALPLVAKYFLKSVSIETVIMVTLGILISVTLGMYIHIGKKELITL